MARSAKGSAERRCCRSTEATTLQVELAERWEHGEQTAQFGGVPDARIVRGVKCMQSTELAAGAGIHYGADGSRVQVCLAQDKFGERLRG